MSCCAGCRSETGGLGAYVKSPLPVPTAFPRTTRVLYDFAERELAAGRDFYITPDFNSETLRPAVGLGFFPALIAAATTAASAVAAVAGPAAEIMAVVSTAKGLKAQVKGSKSGPTADDIAAAVLPNVQAQLQARGVSLPGSVAQDAVSASILDSFGPQNRNLVLYGGLGLAGLLLLKMLR